MTCENCKQLESRIAALEAAASHVTVQQRLNRIHLQLIAAGLNPLDSEAVSPLFLQQLIELPESDWGPWIQDRARFMRYARAKRGSAAAESHRISDQFYEDEND